MNEKEAFEFVANWVEEGLASGRLYWYYWGYGEIVEGLREEANKRMTDVDMPTPTPFDTEKARRTLAELTADLSELNRKYKEMFPDD